jgi:LAO/AO transport system kinase
VKEEKIKEWFLYRKKRKLNLSSDEIFSGIQQHDVVSLAKGITLIESNNQKDIQQSNKLIHKCLPLSGKSIRIGITGVPGVGKSTFIESFGKLLTEKGKKVAVLAIDPSSEKSGGSILGDKTRMNELSNNKNVFIRPSPAGNSLGGVAKTTRESIILCEATGFDVIIIETVGVGQSETTVHSMVDFFLLLMLAGAGDELQGIKRGIMELADLITITKADGDNLRKANQARQEFQNAIHFFPPNENGMVSKVTTCSALNNDGMLMIYDAINEYIERTKSTGYFDKKRKNQDKYWLNETLKNLILSHFFENDEIKNKIKKAEIDIDKNQQSPFNAAEEIFQFYSQNK